MCRSSAVSNPYDVDPRRGQTSCGIGLPSRLPPYPNFELGTLAYLGSMRGGRGCSPSLPRFTLHCSEADDAAKPYNYRPFHHSRFRAELPGALWQLIAWQLSSTSSAQSVPPLQKLRPGSVAGVGWSATLTVTWGCWTWEKGGQTLIHQIGACLAVGGVQFAAQISGPERGFGVEPSSRLKSIGHPHQSDGSSIACLEWEGRL